MKILTLGARLILGLVFLIFGLNHIYTFLHMPMPTGDAGAMGTLMFVHGWFRVYGAAEAACGLLLIGGRFVPLALTILAPILVNILLFHVLIMHGGGWMGLFATVLLLFLIWVYRLSFRGLLDAAPEVS